MASVHNSLLVLAISLIFNIYHVQSDFNCDDRHCCLFKSSSSSTEASIDCNVLTLHECIANLAICEWDCTPANSQQQRAALLRAGYTNKTFIRISRGDGEYQNPHIDNDAIPDSHHGEATTVQQVIQYTRISTVDECGVVYQYSMDSQSATKELNKQNTDSAKKQNTNHDNDDLVERLLRRLTVFGNDGRSQINSQHQMRWTGYLQFSTSAGLEKRCTATLVGACWILTAAHCIHSGNGPFESEWFSNWRFYPGVTQEAQMEHLEIEGLQAWTFTEWTNDYGPNWDYDIGWMQLNTVDAGVEPSAIGWDDTLEDGVTMNTVGYPGDKSWLTKWHQLCSWNYVVSEFMVSDNCDIAPGSSGSPVYKFSTTRYRREILCIISWENDYFNGCARITEPKYDIICSFIGCL